MQLALILRGHVAEIDRRVCARVLDHLGQQHPRRWRRQNRARRRSRAARTRGRRCGTGCGGRGCACRRCRRCRSTRSGSRRLASRTAASWTEHEPRLGRDLDAFRTAVLAHFAQRRNGPGLRLLGQRALVDHHAWAAEDDGVIDPLARHLHGPLPVGGISGGDGDRSELEIDVRHARLRSLEPCTKVLQVAPLGRREMFVLELDVVHAVLVGQHLGDVKHLERAVRVRWLVGKLQQRVEVERHDGNSIQLRRIRLTGALRARCPFAEGSRGQRNRAGREKVASIHSVSSGARASGGERVIIVEFGRAANLLPPAASYVLRSPHDHPRPALRRALAVAVEGVDGRRPPVAGAGHRRQHRALHGGERAAAAVRRRA